MAIGNSECHETFQWPTVSEDSGFFLLYTRISPCSCPDVLGLRMAEQKGNRHGRNGLQAIMRWIAFNV